MTRYELISPQEASSRIARLFECGSPCSISTREQRAFHDGWLSLGELRVFSDDTSELMDDIENGAFEWRLPPLEKARAKLRTLLTNWNQGASRQNRSAHQPKGELSDNKVRAALDQIAATAVRAGLLHPVFDPGAVEEMPFHHSTTVVADTSGVLQGALGFIARNMPARIKIPAIVQMELVNSAERFLSLRRRQNPKHRIDELIEHMKSQGGQRALLRLELRTDTEIERIFLLGDPLRSAFQQDKEISDLNLSTPVKAYADRLILEAARHHQAQSGPNHSVRLLTGDQGLARMSLVEGVAPVYFAAVSAEDVFGACLAGQLYHPFTAEMQRVPLTQVMWELASAFGSARLVGEDGSEFIVSALGEDLPWSPYHSVDDLLWRHQTKQESVERRVHSPPSPVRTSHEESVPASGRKAVLKRRSVTARASFHQVAISGLLRLVCVLDDHQELTQASVMGQLGVSSSRTLSEYRRFLESAKLVEVVRDRWQAQPPTRVLSAALRDRDVSSIRDSLRAAPSFNWFIEQVEQTEVGEAVDMSDMTRAISSYRMLGEITRLCALFEKEVYPTPNKPDVSTFATIALDRYRELAPDNGLVPTGAWLESLIHNDGIHPEVARLLLESASEEGLLQRVTEGSTLQTRFDDRVVHVLRVESGLPVVEKVYLYRGDYLVPGKAGVSLRISLPEGADA